MYCSTKKYCRLKWEGKQEDKKAGERKMPLASHIFSRPLSACQLFCSNFCFLLAAQISVFKLKQNTLNLTLLKNPIGRLGASLIHCRLFVHCVEQLCEQVRSVRLTRIDSASQSLFILIGLCLNFGQPYC